MLFFGFIGFDEVCCMAAKAERPAKVMPRAMAGTLVGAVVFSGLAQSALAAMTPISPGMKSTSFELRFRDLHMGWARWLVATGELCLLPLVVLLGLLPQPEVTAAMSKDGLLPSVFRRQNQSGVYFRGTAITGAFLTLVAFAVPFSVLWDLISLGVLVSFNLTNAALISTRYGNGGKLRKPAVDAVVCALLLLTAAAGWACQHGVLQPVFDGRDPSLRMLAAFAELALACVAVTFGLYTCFPMCGDVEKGGEAFRAFGVPFVPVLAMFCNSLLIFALPVENFLFFAVFMALVFALYFVYKLHQRRHRKAEDLESEASKLSLDSE